MWSNLYSNDGGAASSFPKKPPEVESLEKAVALLRRQLVGVKNMSMSIEEVQKRLPELIAGLQPGEELVIDRDGAPVATLTRTGRTTWPCQAGTARDLPHWMAPDFDAPLEDFREYME